MSLVHSYSVLKSLDYNTLNHYILINIIMKNNESYSQLKRENHIWNSDRYSSYLRNNKKS